jgi:hypothetical protein
MTMLEEEEKASRSWNHMAKKEAHTYHLSVISCLGPFGGVVHNPPRVAHIFMWDELYVVVRPWLETRCSISIESFQ